MKKLLVILFAALCLSVMAQADTEMYEEIHGNGIYTVSQENEASGRLERLVRRFDEGGLVEMAEETERDLDGLFWIAVRNLKRRGHYGLAREIESGWRKQKDTLFILALKSNRDIGDFKPLSQWLATAYDKIEAALGLEICRALRLSDIKTYNYTIPVVFRPCSVNEMQYELHFIHDSKYRGFFPTTAYWATSITCSVATFGAGYFFICSPIAMLVELGADRWAAPWLAPRIWEAACGGMQ